MYGSGLPITVALTPVVVSTAATIARVPQALGASETENVRLAGICGAGGGTRTLTPLVGTADFKSAAYLQFRHPGAGQDSQARYVPGRSELTGNRSRPLPRYASRKVVKAFSLKAGQVATTPLPSPPGGDGQAEMAILLPSEGYGVPNIPF